MSSLPSSRNHGLSDTICIRPLNWACKTEAPVALSSCLNTFRYCFCCADNCCPVIKPYPEQFPRTWRSQAGTNDLLTYWLIDLLAYQPHRPLLSFQRFCHDYLQVYLRPGHQHARSSHGAPTVWVQLGDPDPAMDEQIYSRHKYPVKEQARWPNHSPTPRRVQ